MSIKRRLDFSDGRFLFLWVIGFYYLLLISASSAYSQELKPPRIAPKWADGPIFKNGDFSKPVLVGWKVGRGISKDVFGIDVARKSEWQDWARVDTVEKVLTVQHYGAGSIVVSQIKRVYTHECSVRLRVKLRVSGDPSTGTMARVVVAYKSRYEGGVLGRNVILATTGWSQETSKRMPLVVDREYIPEEGPTVRYLFLSTDSIGSEYETEWLKYEVDVEKEIEQHLIGINPEQIRYIGVYFYCNGWVGLDDNPVGFAQIKVNEVTVMYKPEVLGK